MIELIENILRDDGYKFLKFLSVPGDVIRLERFVPRYLLLRVPHYFEVDECVDDVLGVVSTEVLFPVCGPVDVTGADGRVRKFFFVHRLYGRSVSDCVRLGVEACGVAGREVRHGFVRSLPAGVEDGRVAFGVSVHSAEWMAESCVAVR